MTDEEIILKTAEKIKQNIQEDIDFSEILDRFIKNELKTQEVITVCSNPNILKVLGSSAKKLVVTQSVISNSINNENMKKKGHTSGHNIEISLLKKLPKQLRNPILI